LPAAIKVDADLYGDPHIAGCSAWCRLRAAEGEHCSGFDRSDCCRNDE
jgi:hypothetical protein